MRFFFKIGSVVQVEMSFKEKGFTHRRRARDGRHTTDDGKRLITITV